MQGRSWMAALTLTLTLALSGGLAPAVAGDPPAPSPERPGAGTKAHTVKLELAIAGLPVNGSGCDVEIKPAHAGCKFQPITRHIDSRGFATLLVKDVVSRSADRDCAFAITIREPGQPERTVRRGLRLQDSEKSTPQTLTCYLSSPSRIARNNSETGTAKR